jgi:putative FmdB family regulatory protein
MPIYEHECGACCHKFEILQKMEQDGKNLKCPRCGVCSPKRMPSVFSGGESSDKSSPACSSKGFS